jgi:hypothetical protein
MRGLPRCLALSEFGVAAIAGGGGAVFDLAFAVGARGGCAWTLFWGVPGCSRFVPGICVGLVLGVRYSEHWRASRQWHRERRHPEHWRASRQWHREHPEHWRASRQWHPPRVEGGRGGDGLLPGMLRRLRNRFGGLQRIRLTPGECRRTRGGPSWRAGRRRPRNCGETAERCWDLYGRSRRFRRNGCGRSGIWRGPVELADPCG